MRTYLAILSLLLVAFSCFGSRQNEIDTGEGGSEEESDYSGGGGGTSIVVRDAEVDSSLREYCGDGTVQVSRGEECDGRNLRNQSCRSLLDMDGTLSCTMDCRFNESMCFVGPQMVDGGLWDGGRIIRDAGRDARRIIEIDDGGDGERTAVTGGCARSTGATCNNDSDCQVGGCGMELCYNPDMGELYTPCDCQRPTDLRCGCVNGGCSWWL